MKFSHGLLKGKRFVIILLLLGSLYGCRTYEPPELRAIEDLRIRTVGGDQVELFAKLVFYNPNEVRFKLKSYHIDVYVGENKVTELSDQTDRVIYPEKEFDMNAVATFSLNDGNIISSALGLLSKRMDLRFVGKIRLARNGVSFTIPVDKKEKVKF